MPNFQDPQFQAALMEQVAESLNTISLLTESLQELQNEVGDHSSLIGECKSELILLKERLSSLARLVQGEGLKDSIFSAVVELQTKVDALEKWKNNYQDDIRSSKQTSVTVIVLVVSAVVTILSTGLTLIIPTLFKTLGN